MQRFVLEAILSLSLFFCWLVLHWHTHTHSQSGPGSKCVDVAQGFLLTSATLCAQYQQAANRHGVSLCSGRFCGGKGRTKSWLPWMMQPNPTLIPAKASPLTWRRQNPLGIGAVGTGDIVSWTNFLLLVENLLGLNLHCSYALAEKRL